jgi:hypothetical protein
MDRSVAATGPLRAFRCSACGYGAARRANPHRCPMCGGTSWEEQGTKPYAALLEDLDLDVEAAAEEAATAPLQREVSEVDAASILPGVPFS